MVAGEEGEVAAGEEVEVGAGEEDERLAERPGTEDVVSAEPAAELLCEAALEEEEWTVPPGSCAELPGAALACGDEEEDNWVTSALSAALTLLA